MAPARCRERIEGMGTDVRRLLLILLLVAVPAVFIFLGVRGFVVRNAVVTAQLEVARAPIAGEVTNLSVRPGLALTAEHVAVALRDPHSDALRLDELAAEIETTLRSIETHQASLEWYDATLVALDDELDALLGALQLDLAAQLESVAAEIAAADARATYLAAELERTRRLTGTTASEANLEKAEAELSEAQARQASLQAQARQLRQRLEFLDRALLVVENADDAIAIAATIRQLKNERHALVRAAAELEVRLAALNEELASAQQDFAQRTEATVKVPAGAVVWETFVAEGTAVAVGAPLFTYVDCTKRLTQATVDDSTSELIRARHPVTVYLYGEDEPLAGQVHSIYGSAAQIARSRSLAANVEEVGTTDAIVLIEIPAASELARDFRLCDIGRTAYVEFDGIGFLDPFLNRLW